MTDYERIRNQFNASTICRYGSKPRLEYEPGCQYIECQRDDCKCRAVDGDGIATTAFLIDWNARFAAK